MKNANTSMVEQTLQTSVKQALDRSAADLDMTVRGKLRQARERALARQESRSSAFLPLLSFSRGFVAATVATLALTLWVLPRITDDAGRDVSYPQAQSEISGVKVDTDAELLNVMDFLMSNEDMDLLENLDMYEDFDALFSSGYG